MKNRLLKTFFVENKQRCGVTLLLCVCFLLFAFTPGAAQVKNQRRVTALQLGGAAEGSRVTIVSDTALNDYEAFRRGNRFYVKIPLADLTSTVPQLRADGFEDVEVQKSGDGLIASFKLQPGASARVDQRGNRLDVVFSAPNRISSNTAANRVGQSGIMSGSPARGRDAAGPMPPGSIDTSRDRFVPDRVAGGSENQSSQDPWALTSRSTFGRKSKSLTSNQSAALNSPSPLSSPSSVLSPGTTSSYTPLTSAAPAVSPAARPVTAGSGEFLNWKQKGNAALHWAATNRLATALAALILLSLLLYIFWLRRKRQEKVVKAKQAKTPKVPPKYSAERELDEIFSRMPSERTARQEGAGTPPVTEAVRISSQADIRKQSANAAASAANASHASPWVLTKPTITPDEHREEEEREVFEL